MTASSEIVGQQLSSPGGVVFGSLNGVGGCFRLRTSRVLSFMPATESSEQAKRTAPLKSVLRQQVQQVIPVDLVLSGASDGRVEFQ